METQLNNAPTISVRQMYKIVTEQQFVELAKECNADGGAVVWAKKLQSLYFAFVSEFSQIGRPETIECYKDELFTLSIIIETLTPQNLELLYKL